MREHAAFILVSHSMSNIKFFSDKVMVLNKGKMIFLGNPEDAIKIYESTISNKAEKKSINKSLSLSLSKSKTHILGPQYNNAKLIENVKCHWCNKDGKYINQINSNETIYLEVSFVAKYKIKQLRIGIPIWTEAGEYVTGFSTELDEKKFKVIPDEEFSIILKVSNLYFNPNNYFANCVISDGLEFLYRWEISNLEVSSENNTFWGVVTIPHSWHTKKREKKITKSR
jgi:lipopolysaccharide transport system ATP-binding protein